MTPNEIAGLVINSHVANGVDGISNYERFHFICHVFEVQGIKLNEVFDFDAALATNDPELITAARFLAMLQYEWSTRCHLAGLVTEEDHLSATHYLSLAMAKLRWAHSFLANGRTPPPYPFVN